MTKYELPDSIQSNLNALRIAEDFVDQYNRVSKELSDYLISDYLYNIYIDVIPRGTVKYYHKTARTYAEAHFDKDALQRFKEDYGDALTASTLDVGCFIQTLGKEAR